jgi:hypothetical protein
MFGHIHGADRMKWGEGTSFIEKHQLPIIWKAEGWKTHGAAVFIRRDVWGKGYVPAIEWMADHVQTLLLAMRWGCVDLMHRISRVNFLPGGFSQAHADDVRYNAAIRATKREVELPEYDDIRASINLFHALTGWLNERR